jgi:prepilin-type N-terminal cleavage/methylation domain-containing protein
VRVSSGCNSRSMNMGRLRRAGGFTLIELLVVILIIGILIAVAAPSFLGQTQKAHDSESKQYLTTAYKAATAWAVDHNSDPAFDSYSQGDYATPAGVAAAIVSGEPGLSADTGSCPMDATTDPKHITVDTASGGDLTICNDPDHRVWTLTVANHALQPFPTAPDVVPVPGSNPAAFPIHVLAIFDDNAATQTRYYTDDPAFANYPNTCASDPCLVVPLQQWQYLLQAADAIDPGGSHSCQPYAAGTDTGPGFLAPMDFRDCDFHGGTNGSQLSWDSNGLVTSGPFAPGAPEFTTYPEITGSPVQDNTLTVSDGVWSNGPVDVTYQWQRCAAPSMNCTNLSGATNNTLQVTAADIGKYLKALVTANGQGGQGQAEPSVGPVTADGPPGLLYNVVLDHSSVTGLFASHADGSGEYSFTTSNDYAPIFSPDKSKVLFTSTRNSTYGDVFVMNPDGSNAVQLTHRGNPPTSGARATGWSPDGSKILFTSIDPDASNYNAIWVMNADGSNQHIIVPGDSVAGHGYDNARFSPDGNTIVFATTQSDVQAGIYTADADGGGLAPLLLNSAIIVSGCYQGDVYNAPAYLPNGRIAYSQSHYPGACDFSSVTNQIWTMASNGTDQQSLVAVAGEYVNVIGIASDGNLLYNSSTNAIPFGLSMVDPATGQTTLLVDHASGGAR